MAGSVIKIRSSIHCCDHRRLAASPVRTSAPAQGSADERVEKRGNRVRQLEPLNALGRRGRVPLDIEPDLNSPSPCPLFIFLQLVSDLFLPHSSSSLRLLSIWKRRARAQSCRYTNNLLLAQQHPLR